MSKMKKAAQAVRARALAALEKKSAAARDRDDNGCGEGAGVHGEGAGVHGEGAGVHGEGNGVCNDKATAEVKDASAAPSGLAVVSEDKSSAQCAETALTISTPIGVKEKKSGPPVRFERGWTVPDIFPDGEVCRLLGKNRAYLIRARKSRSRGEDWDAIGHHAGMTAVWILKENPKADLEHITQWRIKPGDGVVSVEVLQHTMDFRKLVCKRLSDGVTVVVMVDDASRFRSGDQFDAQELGGTYRWNQALNRI